MTIEGLHELVGTHEIDTREEDKFGMTSLLLYSPIINNNNNRI